MIYVIAFRLILALICALVASNRGRSALAWFLLGLLLPIIGLIILLVIPNLKVEEERRNRIRKENQRLRERLRKERQVADQRHASVTERLAIHDISLGLDTSAALDGPEPTRIEPGASPPPPAPPPPPPSEAATWYYLVGRDKQGPVPLTQLRRLWRAGRVDAQNYVWRQGMDAWRRIGELADLERDLDG